MKFSAIAAVGDNFELGAGNELLWHLPADFKFFKATTMGAPIIMGRKTFESIGRTLPGRKNVVLTRDNNWNFEGVECFSSIENMSVNLDQSVEHFVIGGSEIYKQFMPLLNRIYLTHVESSFDQADAFFPPLDEAAWTGKKIASQFRDDKHEFGFTIVEYNRK